METKLRGTAGSHITVLLLAVIFLTAGTLPAMASGCAKTAAWQKGDMERPRHHRPIFGIWQDPEMVQKLELTDEQINKLRDAEFTSREKRLELKARLDRLHLEMDRAFAAETVDQEAVLQLAEKIAEARRSLFIRDIESRLAMGKILNADQINKLKQQLWQERKCDPETGRKGRGSNHAA